MNKIRKWMRSRRQSRDRKFLGKAKRLIDQIERAQRTKSGHLPLNDLDLLILKMRFAFVEAYFERRIRKFVRKHKVERPKHGEYRYTTYDYILAKWDTLTSKP